MALNAATVHRAIEGQIRDGIAASYNIAPWPASGKPIPLIEIWPGSPWIVYFESYGSAGISSMNVTLKIITGAANAETELDRVSALVSVGTGESSSIIDALLADESLGGVAQTIQIGDLSSDVTEDGAVMIEIPVAVKLKKVGAQA